MMKHRCQGESPGWRGLERILHFLRSQITPPKPAKGFTESARVQSHTAAAIQSLRDWEVIITRVLEELLRLVHRSSCRITGAALRTRRETLRRVERYALEDPG